MENAGRARYRWKLLAIAGNAEDTGKMEEIEIETRTCLHC